MQETPFTQGHDIFKIKPIFCKRNLKSLQGHSGNLIYQTLAFLIKMDLYSVWHKYPKLEQRYLKVSRSHLTVLFLCCKFLDVSYVTIVYTRSTILSIIGRTKFS